MKMKSANIMIYAIVFCISLAVAIAAPGGNSGGNGVGSIDNECQEYNFSFGVAKWDCDLNDWDGGNSSGLTASMDSGCYEFNWTSSFEIDGFVMKASTESFVFAGGFNGTITNQTKHAISHVTFCGNNQTESEPYCGDNVINQNNETCDGTTGVGPNQVCSLSCDLINLTYCGDGIVQTPNDNNIIEECDGSADEGFTCSQSCELIQDEPQPFCGDNVINQEFEQCDGSEPEGFSCSQKCELIPDEVACYDNLNAFPVTCDGNLIADIKGTSCRTIICEGTQGDNMVLACEKPNEGPKEYFEMYKFANSTDNKVCIGDTCITNNGFARSNTYDSCTEYNCQEALYYGALTGVIQNNTATVTNNATSAYNISFASYKMFTGNTEDQELYDNKTIVVQPNSTVQIPIALPECAYQTDLVCGGVLTPPLYTNPKLDTTFGDNKYCVPPATNNTVEVSVAPWFPQGNNYVLICDVKGFTPDTYSWFFGDGQFLLNTPHMDIYHTFANGSYDVACTASDGINTETGHLQVEAGLIV